MNKTSLCDVQAERDVVAASMISSAALDAVARTLVPGDFASPNAGAAFSAIVALHNDGAAIDAATVADQLRREGRAWDGAAADLMAWLVDVPSPSSAGRYAQTVRDYATRRAIARLARELRASAEDLTKDLGETIDEARGQLGALDVPNAIASPGDVDLEALLSEEDADSAPPVVPGLLAEDDRVVIVAPEGVGKSELARQLVVCAAYGIEPFTGRPMPPVPALLVDLENPRALVRRRLRSLVFTASNHATGPRAPAALWHRPARIDLRKRADRLALEDVLRRNRPKIVAFGPVYKAYSRGAHETDEQVAAEVQAVLDDLRTRYAFALVLEHHAPQAANGTRELRPFGSSLWLRWPEYGVKLAPSRDRPGALVVGRWRGDRSEAAWPDELHRSEVWPWVGWWRDGVPGADFVNEAAA